MDKKLRNKLLATLAIGSLVVTNAPTLLAEAQTEAQPVDSTGRVSFVEPGENAEDEVGLLDPTNPNPKYPVDKVVPGEGEPGYDSNDPDLDEDKNPDKGTTGPLRIDYASNFFFGTNEISNQNKTYYAAPEKRIIDGDSKERPNYVQVTDNRGTLKGWNLSVSQGAQLANDTHELNGAEITLNGFLIASYSDSERPTAPNAAVTLTTDGASLPPLMTADTGAGAGSFYLNFVGEDGDPAKGVQLYVPGASVKKVGNYDTTLTWTLANTPGN